MPASIETLFEQELELRKMPFAKDPQTGRYAVGSQTVSLANLAREFAVDQDPTCIPLFVDAILESALPEWTVARGSVLFILEPNDYEEKSDLRSPLSRRVDRVPAFIDHRLNTWRWILENNLKDWGISIDDLQDATQDNARSALESAVVHRDELDGVPVGMLETTLPLKSPLLLAPNLKEKVAPIIGWPLYAVIPDQDFIYVWPVEYQQFLERIGSVVLREHSSAPHPVTTELFKIDDDGITAIGAFS